MIQDARVAEAVEVERYRERLRLLREIDRSVLKAQSVDQTAAAAVEGFRRLVPCLRASVARFDFDCDRVTLLATCSDSELQLRVGADARLSEAFFLGRSPDGAPHCVADLNSALSAHPWIDLMRTEGVRGYVSVPLTTEGDVIGALTFGLREPGPPSPEAMEIAEDVADQLAVAIVNARMHEEIRQQAADLEARVAARTAALRLSEARLRAIFEAAPIGMLLATLDGRLLQANPAVQTLIGYSEAELRAMTFADLTLPDADCLDQVASPDPSGQRTPPLRMDMALRRRDGRALFAHVTLAHVRASPEAGNLAVAMIEDTTAARQTQAALIQAERLAITGRLGASLAHEINNPLQSIIGCLGLADETLSDPAEAGRYLAVAREELRRVARTVAQLRDLQVVSATERKAPVDLNELLEQLLLLNASRCAQQRIAVVWQPAPRLPNLPLVSDRIRQVFLNILLNALDAMPGGGKLTAQTVSTRKPEGVRVTIRDTGDGMTPDVLARIFEPFYSTKKSGLGLGLFTSRSIIDWHQGAIEVRSRPGRGSAFEVWLPAAPPHQPARAPGRRAVTVAERNASDE